MCCDMLGVRCVSLYSPSFTGTHCVYTQRDGQAELTWVAVTYRCGCTCRSTNQAQHSATLFIETITLPLSYTANNYVFHSQ